MVKRGFLYYLSLYLEHYLLGVPTYFFLGVGCRLSPSEMRSGIRVVDPLPETRSDFTNGIGAALDLMARVDKIRFKRVQAEIRVVISGPKLYIHSYEPMRKSCTINLPFWRQPNDPAMTIKLLAAAIIREATFGDLIARGVLPTFRNRGRYQMVCLKEMQRFMNRVGVTTGVFDPKRLAEHALYKRGH